MTPPNCARFQNQSARFAPILCGPVPDRVQDLADGAGVHELDGTLRRRALQPSAVEDRVDASGLACTRRTSASCASDVTPGLSTM